MIAVAEGVLGQPTYFGPPARRRFGMLHWPAAAVRGAAVVLPPIGYEAVGTFTTLRVLSERLAADGVVVLRADLDGGGNSLGVDTDPGRVAAWRASVVDAVAALREWTGVAPIVIGARLGATLAAQLAADELATDRPAGLVLWDPVADGRRWIRALRLLAGEAGGEHPLVVAGVTYTDECRDDLAGLRLDLGALAVAPGLLITRPGSAAPDDLPATWTMASLPGTDHVLDVDAELAVVPEAIVDSIVRWVAEHAAAPDIAPSAPAPVTLAEEVVERATLVHHAQRVGAANIFCVETTRSGTAPTSAVVLLNNGVAASIGPGRAWVGLARTLALAGHRVVRMDIGGIGDTPAHPGRPANDTYAPTAGRDLAEVVRLLQATGSPSVAALGLCSGATFGFDAAVAGVQLATVISINPRFDAPFPDRRADRRMRAAAPTARLLAIPLSKTPLLPWFDRVPRLVWKWLARLHLVGLPTQMMEPYLAKGGDVLLVFGDAEPGLSALRRRAGDVLDAMLATGRVRLIEVPGLDHSMFRHVARDVVTHHCLQHLARVLPTGGGGDR